MKLVVEIEDDVFDLIKHSNATFKNLNRPLHDAIRNGTPITKDNAKRQLSMILAEIEFESELEACKTVEDVEALRCNECARNHHWGWCDAPNIKCAYKDRIRKILGKTDYTYTNEESILAVLEGEEE